MKNILLILIVSLIGSCESQRCSRITKKAMKHGCLTATSDTITIRDTIRGWSYDSVFVYDTNSITDTLIVSNGKDSIVTIVKWKERTIRQIKTEKDTIVESKVITNNKAVYKVIKPTWYQRGWWLWIILTFILTIWLVKYLREDYNVNKEL